MYTFTIAEKVTDNKMVVPCQTIMYNQSYSLQTGSFRNENFVDIIDTEQWEVQNQQIF